MSRTKARNFLATIDWLLASQPFNLEGLAPWRSRWANCLFDNGGDGVGSLKSFSRRSFISLVKVSCFISLYSAMNLPLETT